MSICQSCSMPMEKEEMFGKNKDGSRNEEYCIYCYPEGEFKKPDETFDEMIETCVPFMLKEGMNEESAREYLVNKLKPLKRWRK
ncbi:MAG: zinc ribbon domain-containing protein [Clostridiales bacterium]